MAQGLRYIKILLPSRVFERPSRYLPGCNPKERLFLGRHRLKTPMPAVLALYCTRAPPKRWGLLTRDFCNTGNSMIPRMIGGQHLNFAQFFSPLPFWISREGSRTEEKDYESISNFIRGSLLITKHTLDISCIPEQRRNMHAHVAYVLNFANKDVVVRVLFITWLFITTDTSVSLPSTENGERTEYSKEAIMLWFKT